MRTRQRALLIRLANIRHVREQPHFRAHLHKRGEHRRDQLHYVNRQPQGHQLIPLISLVGGWVGWNAPRKVALGETLI